VQKEEKIIFLNYYFFALRYLKKEAWGGVYPSITLERGSVYPCWITTKGVMYSFLGRRGLNS